MPPQLIARLKQAGTQVNGMTLGQKVVAVIGIGVLLLGGSAFYRWVNTPDMVAAYSGGSASDAAAITDQLTSDGITNTLDGTAVMVASADADSARAKIAQAGLPKGEQAGYSILDQQGVTTTQFQQKVTYQRAVEGELEKTIEQIDGVQSAVVHLAVPEETVFTETQAKTKASVLIDTGADKATDDQVNAIIQLVSSSVPNLDPTQVTVSDAKGELLSAAGQGAVGQGDEKTTEYESKVQDKIQAILDQTLGAGKAIASVNATLNFDATNRQTTTYTPSGAPANSSSSEKEVLNGSGSSSATGGALGYNGVLGPDGTTVDAGASAGSGSGGYTKTKDVEDAANNVVVDSTIVAPGDVERQSVAVVVDQSALASIGEQNLAQLVTTAAGIDTARGDQVSVTPATFDTSAADAAAKELAAAKAEQKSEEQFALIKQGAIALGVLILAIIVLIAWRRAVKKAKRETVDLGELERLYPDAPSGEVLGATVPSLASYAPTSDHLLVAPEPEPEALRRQEFGQLVDTQPAEVANLLRGWLAASKKG